MGRDVNSNARAGEKLVMISRFAFVFPGQGSQSIGMLSSFKESYPDIQRTFEEVSDAVSWDVWALLENGPLSQLNETQYTQVVMLASGVAIYRLFERLGLKKPDMMAGHSLGEYTALVCADALSLKDAAKLVEARGRLMQEAIPLGKGAMAAIVGLDDDVVFEICKDASSEDFQVMPANYNAPGQVVIAGHTEAISLAVELSEKKGARLAKILPVSVPCHCSLLNDMSEIFQHLLEETIFKKPSIPVLSHVDLMFHDEPEKTRKCLKEQLFSSVRWVETIEKMQNEGIQAIVECGPGRVLAGLMKRISRSLLVFSAGDAKDIPEIMRALSE